MAEIDRDNSELIEDELSPEWRESARIGIEDALGFLKEGLIPAVNLSPFSDFAAADGRTFSELSTAEQEFLVGELLSQIGFDNQDETQRPVSSYRTTVLDNVTGEPQEREMEVLVYQTGLSESDGIYLHYMAIGVERDYIAAGVDYRF